MKIITLSRIVLFFVSVVSYSQGAIKGSFPALRNQQVKLIGYEGFNTYTIDSVRVSEQGAFQLSFSTQDNGMGYLAGEDGKAFIVILAAGEDLKLEGEFLSSPETVVIISGKQNQLFEQYATEHPRRQQALSAWDFLARIYSLDPLFAVHDKPKTNIEAEKHRIKQEDMAFLAGLDSETYVSWYLPVRKLVSSVPTIAQYNTEEIPAAIAAFRSMDYTDESFYKSGLLRDAIESQFWLIENSGRTLDSVYVEMRISIDHLMNNLLPDERKLNLITDYLFNLLEQRSLFEASEYLALKMLNETRCTINNDLAARMESYRAMKKGNTAPDIVFTGKVFRNGTAVKNPARLSEIAADYTVIVFGASWCPKCVEELYQIPHLYEKWKSKGVEVVFVSLDTAAISYQDFTKSFPFISLCDYKKWETQAAMDYYVFAKPTMFLLDNDQKIILRPNSVKQIDAWVDFYIGKPDK